MIKEWVDHILNGYSRLFQKYFSDISSALTANHQSCLVLANLCCSRYLIDQQVRNQIQEEKGIYAANTLLKCLEAKVVVEPSCFEAILDVLKEECMLCAIIENMQKDYKDVEWLEPTADLPHPNIGKFIYMIYNSIFLLIQSLLSFKMKFNQKLICFPRLRVYATSLTALLQLLKQ